MRPYFCSPLKWSVGQGVKTPPFHGGITGSIPVRSTKRDFKLKIYRLFHKEQLFFI